MSGMIHISPHNVNQLDFLERINIDDFGLTNGNDETTLNYNILIHCDVSLNYK